MSRSVERLRSALLASLGLALSACGANAVGAEDEGGVTTDPRGDGASVAAGAPAAGTTGEPSMTTTVPPDPSTTGPDPDPDTGDGDGDPPLPKFDLPPQPDLPPLGDCTLTEVPDPNATLGEHPECPIVLDDGICWSTLVWGCVDLEPRQTCEQLCPEGDCIAEWWNCAGDTVAQDVPVDLCGPYEIDGQCCTLAEFEEFCGTDGRPFVVDGVAREARLRGPVALGSRSRVRRRLADHWAAVALAEHASIASFAQFAAQLLALGAPPELIRAALEAADDEARHARFALARATEHAGAALTFGALDTRGAGLDVELEQVVLACVRDACVGETLAALELEAAAARCPDDELAAGLWAIAADEARHAALAWRFVQWALGRAPRLRPAVAAAFAALQPGPVAGEHLDGDHERAELRAGGCLPADERRAVELEGWRELLLPCARALLDTDDRAPRPAPRRRS
jgi:hypothetical protein